MDNLLRYLIDPSFWAGTILLSIVANVITVKFVLPFWDSRSKKRQEIIRRKVEQRKDIADKLADNSFRQLIIFSEVIVTSAAAMAFTMLTIVSYGVLMWTHFALPNDPPLAKYIVMLLAGTMALICTILALRVLRWLKGLVQIVRGVDPDFKIPRNVLE